MSVPGGDRPRVVCVIPAKDEAERIGATVTAAMRIDGVAEVLVCDDGSSDDTGVRAAAQGAVVVSHRRNRGKAAAIESAVNALGIREQRDRSPEADVLLLLDADLGDTATAAAPLLPPVLTGRAALTIGVLPPQQTADGGTPGGFGLVLGTAARGIKELTGFESRAPLSGQRCLTRRAFELCSPLAAGWGIEVGMTVDVLRAGLQVEEVDVELRHRPTGTDLAGQLHRAKQLRDVTRALAARGLVQSRLNELKSAGGVTGLLSRLRS